LTAAKLKKQKEKAELESKQADMAINTVKKDIENEDQNSQELKRDLEERQKDNQDKIDNKEIEI